MPGDLAPKGGWRMERDSLSKAMVYFLDGNQRTFYSFDWRNQFARRYKAHGLSGLHKRIVQRYTFVSQTILIVDVLTDKIIEKYFKGIRVPLDIQTEDQPANRTTIETEIEMKKVVELYERLNPELDQESGEDETDASFEGMYSNLEFDDGKIHVLFISPVLNGTGYYRMILPYFELNKTQTHSAVISNLHKWNFTLPFEDYEHAHDPRLWEWADYVVFPAIFKPLNHAINSALALNPDIQFVMDIDTYYHALSEGHPQFKRFGKQEGDQLLMNLSLMDVVTGPSPELLECYLTALDVKGMQTEVQMIDYPNLLSEIGYEDIPAIKQNSSDVTRIGLIGNTTTWEDMISIASALKNIKLEFGAKIELIFFGWDGKTGAASKVFDNLDFTYSKSVAFTKYHSRLNALRLDIALLPMLDKPFNTVGKSCVKYLEASSFQIACVASVNSPYGEIIQDGLDGLLASTADEWYDQIKLLIEDKEGRLGIGMRAFQNAWKNHRYSPGQTQLLQEIFI
jgi:glycosyltransferase involved in cell wall biosynthesis